MGTKGLEELMTYNTWVAMQKLGKEDTYGIYPDGGASVYSGGYFRTKYYNNSNATYTSSKYVAYFRECLTTVLNVLAKKYGTNKKISDITTLSADVDAIVEDNNGIPIAYKSYLKNFISNYE